MGRLAYRLGSFGPNPDLDLWIRRHSPRSMAAVAGQAGLIAASIVLFVAACSGSGGSGGFGPLIDDPGTGSAAGSDLDVCSLLSTSELITVLGEAPTPEESEPAGPFTGCSWGTGDVLVSVAQTGNIILAPGEDDCPSAGLGDESYACEGRVKFLTNGTHVTVSTIDPFVSDDQLQSLAETVLENISG